MSDQHSNSDGARRVAVAVIEFAINDYLHRGRPTSEDAEAWFASEDEHRTTYRWWSEIAGLSPVSRERIKERVLAITPGWVGIHRPASASPPAPKILQRRA